MHTVSVDYKFPSWSAIQQQMRSGARTALRPVVPRAALARELDRVAAQVRDDLPQPDLVADDPEAFVGRGRVRAEANLVDVGVEFDSEGDAFGGGGDLNVNVR